MEKKDITKRISISFKDDTEDIFIYGDTIDELIEVLEEMKNSSIIFSFIKVFPVLSKEQWKKLDKLILTSKDTDKIYDCLQDRVRNNNEISEIEKYQDVIIASKNPEYIYNFAKDIEGADVLKLQEAIIASEEPQYIYNFAKDVEGADILKLQEAIIASRNSTYIYFFAKDVEGADILKLQDVVIECKDLHYIFCFAKDIEGADILKSQDAIIASKNEYFSKLFKNEVEGVDLPRLKKAVRDTNDFKFMIRMFFDKYI